MVRALKLWIAAAALGLGVMAFSAPAEARGFGGFHGGGRGFGHFRSPVVLMRPGASRAPFLDRRGFVSRQLLFRRRFADSRRFFFRHHGFVEPFAFGFVGPTYNASVYAPTYAISPDDQGPTETPYSYQDPYNVSGAYGDRAGGGRADEDGCSLLLRLESSGGHLHVRRTRLCN
jgi:hypothetical protein